jgi:multicomponent Na+:H+ antiporter subunit B
MNSLILLTATRYLFPIFLLFSLLMLLRGHDEPGGGFIGGLLAAMAFCLLALAGGVQTARQMLRVEEHRLIAIGLMLSVLAGLVGLVEGRPFLSSAWVDADVPLIGHLKFGTPVLFDCGVYLVVVGVVLMMVFALAEQDEEEGC